MKIINDSFCNLCPLKAQGTFIHMFWDCPPVGQLWSNVASKLSDLIQETVPVNMRVSAKKKTYFNQCICLNRSLSKHYKFGFTNV